MKVIIVEFEARSRYVSREFSYVLRALIDRYGWTYIETAQLLSESGSLQDKLLRRLGALPQVVLFWEAFPLLIAHQPEMRHLECQKCLFFDDLHGNDSLKAQKVASAWMCDRILATYAPVFADFYPEIAREKEIVWVPHAASADFMLPFNEHAENAVFLSGAISWHYPFRQRVDALRRSTDLPIVYQPHPGYHCNYDYERDEQVGRGYARTINAYRVGFTDALTYGYLVAKHFEIPATGALLLADRAVSDMLRMLGFIDREHYVSTSQDDLEATIQYLLDEAHHPRLDLIRKKGQALVWERHTTDERARLIDEVCGAGA